MKHPSAALQPGFHVGDLQINAILGVGSFGITYLATDPAIGTRFALKEYLPAGQVTRRDDGSLVPNDAACAQLVATGLEQFLNEARVVAALDNPHVVKVLRYFEANGTAYFLMPYYQGLPLDHKLKSAGALNPDDVRTLLLALMEGLEYIHAQGIIHQDIKPANIYITERSGPILLDFGVAVAHNTDTPGKIRLGSAGYAAPEQSDADGHIGPWTDIYALAATLYRCITGIVPAAASDRLAALAAGDEDPLTPLTELVTAQHPAGAHYGGIQDVIELGLQLSPRQRPRDVKQWKKSFKSLDWRRSVVGASGAETYPQEEREWLPRILLGLFLLAMVAIAVFLFRDKSPEDQITLPDFGTTESPLASAKGQTTQVPTSQETTRWQAAVQADTIEAYRRFITDYPDSVYRNQAEIQLDILDEKAWQELAAEDSVAAYQDYLDLFPAGLHQTEAMVRIDEIKREQARQERQRLEQERLEKQAWQTAGSHRTIASFDRYISDWPSGLHIEEANRIRRLLKDRANDNKAFEAATGLNTKDAYQAYIDAFPRGLNIAAALQRLDDLDLRPGKSFKDCADCPTMMVLPAGTYWQGSEETSALSLSMEKPRRQVTINRPFAVSIHEVTMAEWDACVNEQGCTTRPKDNGWGRGQRPVIMVSWNDAQEYLRWISEKTSQSYRLPSESEWEYFARAGEESDWLGGDPAQLCKYANIAGTETGFKWQHPQCSDKLALGTAPVGSFRANSFGLYDTIGNVAEWTSDCMNLSYLDAPVDGSAWGRGICSSHMTRGGSWITGSREIRLPARFNLKNGDRNDFTGFRIVRTIED